MISDTARLRPSLLALSGGIVASTVAALYVVLITREDSVPRERVQIAFIASMLIATGATGATGAAGLTGAVWPRAYVRAVLLSAAGAGMVVWGTIGMFTIGLPLLIAAIPTWGAAVRVARRQPGSAPAPTMEMATAAMVVLVLSFGGLGVTG